MPRKRATVLGPVEKFQKNLRTIVVLRRGYNPSTFYPVSRQCSTKWLVIRGYINVRCGEISQSSSRIAELKKGVSFFEKLAYSLRYRGVSAGFLSHNRKHCSFFRGQIWKLGGKYCPPQKLAPLVDSEFNVDYDFAIKHDLIQSDE